MDCPNSLLHSGLLVSSFLSLSTNLHTIVSFKKSKFYHVPACPLVASNLPHGLHNFPSVYFYITRSHLTPTSQPWQIRFSLTGMFFPPNAFFSLLKEFSSSSSPYVPPLGSLLSSLSLRVGPLVIHLHSSYTSFQHHATHNYLWPSYRMPVFPTRLWIQWRLGICLFLFAALLSRTNTVYCVQ